MKLKIYCAIIFSLLPLGKNFGQQNINAFFDSCKVEGSITIYDYNNGIWITNDLEDSKKETLPASTFKIINTLIALETCVINSLNDTIKFHGNIDTIKYGNRPEIFRDITVKEAFQKSAGWAYVDIAKKIGTEKYLQFLDSCNYGNRKILKDDIDFWNFGSFGVSPQNQIELLVNIYEEKLSFSKFHIKALKEVMIVEQTDKYTLRAKTGWTRFGSKDTGWWVGYFETSENIYFFATRIYKDRTKINSDFGNCRKEITLSIFRELGINDTK